MRNEYISYHISVSSIVDHMWYMTSVSFDKDLTYDIM